MRKTHRASAVAALAALSLLPVAAPAASKPQPAPADVGHSLETPPPAGAPRYSRESVTDLAVSYRSPRQELRYPGSPTIKIHFNSLRLAPGDYLTVRNETGSEVHTYHADPSRGQAPAGDSSYTTHRTVGFAAMSISDDAAVVELHRADRRASATALDNAGYGARIDRVWHTLNPAEFRAANRYAPLPCAKDGRLNVACYRDDPAHAREYANSGPVAALWEKDTHLYPYCTTAKVGNGNTLLTARHCGRETVAKSEVWFGYECAECSGTEPKAPVKVSADKVLAEGASGQGGGGDYLVYRIKDADLPKIKQFGTLYLDSRAEIPHGEHVYMPGHGSLVSPDEGYPRPKRLAVYEDPDGKVPCAIRPNPDHRMVSFRCDTRKVNSGGPVISRATHKIVGTLYGGGDCTENGPNNGIGRGPKAAHILAQTGSLIDNRVR